MWAILKIGSLFTEAGKSIPMLVNTAGSKNRFVSYMSQYSPEFSYEYFSDKVVSMIKMIMNCPHCGARYEVGDDDWIITKLS